MVTEENVDIAKRIDMICEAKQLTYNKLAKLIGISSTTFYQLTSGRTKQLSIEVLIKIHQELGIDIAWLATGEGEMEANAYTRETETPNSETVEQLNARIHQLQDQVDHLKYTINLQRELLAKSEFISVGKSEGVAIRPLSTPLSFEAMMRQYKQIAGGDQAAPFFFLAQTVAKSVAPGSFQ